MTSRRHDAAKENEKTMHITLDNFNLYAAKRHLCEQALIASGSIVEAVSCGTAGEARSVVDSYVAARRRHDMQVLELRRQARANFRMILEDLDAQEADATATIDAAKGELKTIDKRREEAKSDLRSPQITFNFVAELERARSLSASPTEKDRQTDIEDKPGGAANDTTTRARGAATRARQEAPTPA